MSQIPSETDDYSDQPAIEERRVDVPPPTTPAALSKLLALWRSLAVDEQIPHRDQFDVFILRPWLGHVMIYEAVDGGRDFRNRLEGSEVVMLTGQDWTGRCASEVDVQFGSRMLSYMQEAVRSGEPCIHTMWMFQNEAIRVTRLMMPIKSRPDGPVDQILAVLYADRT
ncbi:MAG TPA: PAS domain-containing protein [Dongiaceae bacterium]|jgi:hypothetical protein|nr:PAS domain-containing protein [Dongiaceae bacterium]